LIMVVTVTSCGSSSNSGAPLDLTILHINDHHSYLDGRDYDLPMAGTTVRVQLGGMSYIHSLLKEYRDDHTLFLSSGELNGTLFYNMFGRGEADFDVFNILNPDAYMPGNHEFDEGDAHFAELIGRATFPILSGNIKPTSMSPLYGVFGDTPYVIKKIGGQKIAVIGVIKIEKTKHSSMVSDDVDFIDETEFVISQVELVKKQGVNKIILLSHLGYDFDMALAARTSDIDIIVGGDTHNLLDSTGKLSEMSLPVTGEYPTVIKNSVNKDVYVVQAWEYASGMGKLDVKFDKYGEITEIHGNIILPVGNYRVNVESEWVDAEGDTLNAIKAVVAGSEVLAEGSPSSEIDVIINPMKTEIQAKMMEKIGTVAAYLPFDRIPEPFDDIIGTPNGSFAGQVVADAFLHLAPTADMAIQNAGGVRAAIPAGDFTMATALTVLPFSNTIAIIRITGDEIINVLDEAIRYAHGPSGSTGSFPYASHLRYDVWVTPLNVSADSPARVAYMDATIKRAYNVQVKDRVTGVWGPIDPLKEYTVVTNSFTVLGNDNYLAFKRAIDNDPDVVIDLNVQYAVPLIDYVRELGDSGKSLEFDQDNYCIKSAKDYSPAP